jgi:hypothetical protein
MISEIKTSQVPTASPVSTAQAKTSAADAEKARAASAGEVDAVSVGATKVSAGTYDRTMRKLNAAGADGIKSEAERRYVNMRELVKQLLLKLEEEKKGASTEGADAQSASKAQSASDAQAAISEDGEWGVKAVSDRIVQFAIAISGGDKTKYQELKDAIDEGFGQATKALGGELPGISQETYKETMRKLDAWKNGENPDSGFTA